MAQAQPQRGGMTAALFAHKAILWWLPFLYLLISDSFYLRTYDSAQVKITLVQMGGVCLLGLWLSQLLEEGRGAFTKTDLVCLVPFLAYLGYGVFSFIHAPYKFSSLDGFLRRVFYMTVPLIVIREFHEQATSRLTRILIWTTWITAGYGFLQWFDTSFFPPGAGNGPDPFIWRGAFGNRVFSTFGNPNFFADFLVIMSPVLFSQYLKTRDFKLLPLIAILIWDLYWTQTKGAWIGFAFALLIWIATHAYFFDWEAWKKRWKALAAGSLLMLGLLAGALAYKLNQSFTSVSFRLFTWEATWEMIMTQPLIGTGIGSFWVIYPAFRRPPIFHIEGKHNTETDHSEDEYLEVLFDEGILGFGVFLWLLLSTFVVAYRALGLLTASAKQGQRAPPRAYDILGYLVALQGMLLHNFFDVSMRFVSSGVYLGLLSGLVVNLSRGLALRQLHGEAPAPEPAAPSGWAMASSFFLWPARLAAWGGLGWMGWRLLGHFSELQGPLARLASGGEILQWWISWGCFLFCVLSQGFIFARLSFLARNALVPLLAVLMLFPLDLTWGFFRADVHHNIAIFFSRRQDWENALKNYLIVGRLNPAFVMASYFKGNVFNDRFSMTKIANENWGDKKDQPRDDFERALAAYEEVRDKAPNYVQMHHQMGALYMKKADWERAQGRPAEAEKALDTALEYFELYRKIDPVFPPNYFRMAHIHLTRQRYDKAIAVYKALIDAKECAVAPSLAAKPWLRRTILSYHGYTEEGGVWRHMHDQAENYLNLGNGYLLAGNLPEAEKAYRHALKLEPSNPNVQRNLQVLYGKARSEGRLKELAPPAAAPPSFELSLPQQKK